AFGDLDDDGDLDVVINNFDAGPTVLRNDSRAAGSWLKVELRGHGLNRSAIGARVTVEAGGRTLSRYLRSSDSFLSHHDPRLHFGLGAATAVDRLTVDWPDGSSETLPGTDVAALAPLRGDGVLIVIEQGRGVVSPAPLQ
ncbi:MAG: CRTAC1 family protein, partial [bacterium]|nr:CRTAC1 family protein [bacterium]